MGRKKLSDAEYAEAHFGDLLFVWYGNVERESDKHGFPPCSPEQRPRHGRGGNDGKTPVLTGDLAQVEAFLSQRQPPERLLVNEFYVKRKPVKVVLERCDLRKHEFNRALYELKIGVSNWVKCWRYQTQERG